MRTTNPNSNANRSWILGRKQEGISLIFDFQNASRCKI